MCVCACVCVFAPSIFVLSYFTRFGVSYSYVQYLLVFSHDPRLYSDPPPWVCIFIFVCSQKHENSKDVGTEGLSGGREQEESSPTPTPTPTPSAAAATLAFSFYVPAEDLQGGGNLRLHLCQVGRTPSVDSGGFGSSCRHSIAGEGR